MISNTEIAAFYNGFGNRFLLDYVNCNVRVTRAVDRVCEIIGTSNAKVLDVGCGVGGTSFSYLDRCPQISVLGVDISPECIEIAKLLFRRPGLKFAVSSLDSPPSESPFDVIALVDVYEHIPRLKWDSFNQTLASCLSPNGAIVLTTPSPFHQSYLAKHNPAGLQIVDETVELSDIFKLQEAIGGRLTLLEYVDIWKTNDYVHVVIERNPPYGASPAQHGRTIWQKIGGRLSNKRKREQTARRRYVKRVLGIDIY